MIPDEVPITNSAELRPPDANRPFLIRMRTRIGAVLSLLLLISLLFLHPRWVGMPLLDFTLSVTGAALIVAGIGIRLWATLYIGGRKSTALQRSGPYSLVRHPLYLGSLLLGIGVAVVTENPLVLLLVLLYFGLQYGITIRYEEQVLAEAFGEEHTAYMREVPCFLPRRLRFDRTLPTSLVLPPLLDEARNSLLFLAIIPLVQLILLLHELCVLPYVMIP